MYQRQGKTTYQKQLAIAFTGTSSTGKTTVAKGLIEKLPWLNRLDVDARSLLISQGYREMDKMTPEETSKFQLGYIARKREIEAGKDFYVTDRSFVDCYAYWQIRDSIGVEAKANDDVTSICKEWAGFYSHHFLFRWGDVPFEHDGFRSEDKQFHELIGNTIEQTLISWGLQFSVVPKGSVCSRVDYVIKRIREIGICL